MIPELKKLDKFISYLEETTDDEWCVDVVRTRNNEKNCLFGHLINWFYGCNYEDNVMDVWDFFEEAWATSYMVYPVNDGKNSKYQQDTPKERCIAYLRNLNSGKERRTWEIMNEISERSKLLAE